VESVSGNGVVGSGATQRAACDACRPRAENPAVPARSTILLVEDEQAVRALASRVLRRKGYNVLEAMDGEDALRIASQHDGPLALLITDLIMPGLNGPRLADSLAATRPGMRVLLISGCLEEEVTGLGNLRDASFLGKPFLPDDLVAHVEKILSTSANSAA
jgi:DNA-binding response OmpR family regulator